LLRFILLIEMNRQIFISLSFFIFMSLEIFAQSFEELAPTPPMGWNSWKKFSIYSCAGSLTCQGQSGSRGYQFQDARQYIV